MVKVKRKQILAGAMAFLLSCSTLMNSGLTAFAAETSVQTATVQEVKSESEEVENTDAALRELPKLEEVKEQLEESEIVTAEDITIVAGENFDAKSDYTGLKIDNEKVKVSFVKAEDEAGQKFDFNVPGSYQAFYRVDPVSGHPSYQIVRRYGMEEMSYEEAVKEFQTTINDDRVSGGFARLFCDSMSSAMGLLPVFLIVFLWMYDLKAKSSSLIYVKKLSSKKIIFTRFLSVLILVLIPNFLLSLESLIPLSKFALRNGYDINYFAYTKYIIFWLLPTIMIVLALGTFLTVITDSPIAILIQLIWWFVDRGMTGLSGDTDLYTLMLRHNTLRGSEIINAQSGMILTNRLLYMALSFIFLEITVIVFEKKRRGKFDFWRHYTEYYNAIKRKL